MSNCAIVGINWGDEGKGRMVDLIAREYDIVCRYQGGNNAGHTIVERIRQVCPASDSVRHLPARRRERAGQRRRRRH